MNFNSIKVRLEHNSLIFSTCRFLNFNSIKVRLELLHKEGRQLKSSFQFHKGAIRTTSTYAKQSKQHNFNSIKVRLERLAKVANVIEELHFNSIKVRLERNSKMAVSSRKIFQFHKGAIRT